jgi:formylglycine-generating enzyme required for sulfatase activity
MVRCINIAIASIVVSGLAGGSRAETPPPVDSITIHSRTGVSFEFVFVPPGEYIVGREVGCAELLLTSVSQVGSGLDEGPRRKVVLERGFYLCRRQVTASQFAAYLNAVGSDEASRAVVLNERSNLTRDVDGRYTVRELANRRPANTVTWDGAVAFTRWFTAQSGWSVRLPTEDEWEASTRTPRGFRIPTGGGAQPIDPKTGLLPGIRADGAGVDVDFYSENMTSNGIYHALNSVGDWTSDVYRSDRADEIPDFLVAEYEGGHVLKRCLNRLTEREPALEVGTSGVFGLRLLLEATTEGSPLRAASQD